MKLKIYLKNLGSKFFYKLQFSPFPFLGRTESKLFRDLIIPCSSLFFGFQAHVIMLCLISCGNFRNNQVDDVSVSHCLRQLRILHEIISSYELFVFESCIKRHHARTKFTFPFLKIKKKKAFDVDLWRFIFFFLNL